MKYILLIVFFLSSCTNATAPIEGGHQVELRMWTSLDGHWSGRYVTGARVTKTLSLFIAYPTAVATFSDGEIDSLGCGIGTMGDRANPADFIGAFANESWTMEFGVSKSGDTLSGAIPSGQGYNLILIRES